MSPDRDDRSEAPDPDVDALFAQIVAGWDEEQTTPVPPWPATEDLPERTGQDSSGGGRQAQCGVQADEQQAQQPPARRPLPFQRRATCSA